MPLPRRNNFFFTIRMYCFEICETVIFVSVLGWITIHALKLLFGLIGAH